MFHKDSSPKLIQGEALLMENNNSNSKMKRVVDMAPFFLIEATGDSEGDFDDQNLMVMMMASHNHHDHHDDDDAESCSHDHLWYGTTTTTTSNLINGIGATNDSCRGSHIPHHHHHQKHHGNDEKHHHDHDDDDDYDVGKDTWKGCHSKMTSEVMSTANSRSSRSNSCVDSSEGKKMTEKERSRLFWETCLAS